MKVNEYFNLIDSEEKLENFFDEFFKLYPDEINNKDGYIYAIDGINNVKITKTKFSAIIDLFYNDLDEVDSYISVYGVNPESEEDEFGQSGIDIHWAIEYVSWSEWLDMDIIIKTNDSRCDNNTKILAHILWEMTWCGYTQEHIDEQCQEIKYQKENLDDILENNSIEEALEQGLLVSLDVDKM